MFEIYDIDNKISEKRYKEMHLILRNDYINKNGIKKYNENKSVLENDGYDNWVNMIRNTPNYHILLLVVDDRVIGFICFMYIEKKLCLSEVQIKKEYQGKQNFLRKMLKKVLEISNKNLYDNVCCTIKPNNKKSIAVFSHIGMKNTKGNWYEISYDDMINWILNSKKD